MKKKNSLIIYSLAYQDGIIHSLKRIIARECYGEYLNPNFLYNSIVSYEDLYKDYTSKELMFDAAYLCGYAHAMDFIFYMYSEIHNVDKLDLNETICLYYLPKGKMYNDLKEFNKNIKEFKTKKYIDIANKILKDFGNENFEFEIHHLPFL